jgi:RimJ/RimL family protein N-acetyltransferase
MKFKANSTPYRIETSRTIIRCWDPCDAEILQQAINSSVDSLIPWMPWAKGEPKEYITKIDTLRFFRGNFDLNNEYVYGIFNKNESIVLGGCGLHTRSGEYSLEIGYWINKEYQNKGYATEITRSLIKTAFELSDIDNIRIQCDIKNNKSLRVIEKVGFIKEGIELHKQMNANDEFQDIQLAVLLRSDYNQSTIKNEQIKVYNAIKRQIL